MPFRINTENRLATAYPQFYDELDKKKLFTISTELFTFGLTVGALYNVRSDKKRGEGFTRYSTVENYPDLKNVIDFIYLTLTNGSDEKDKWHDLCSIADGGIEIIKKYYEAQGILDIPRIYDEAKKKWPERAKEIMQKILQEKPN